MTQEEIKEMCVATFDFNVGGIKFTSFVNKGAEGQRTPEQDIEFIEECFKDDIARLRKKLYEVSEVPTDLDSE